MKIKIKATKLMEALRNSVDLGDGVYQMDLEIEESQEESPKITPDDYYKFNALLEDYKVNLKDIREIITLAHSFWSALRSDPWATETLILKYHDVHKDEAKDKVYSEELIEATLGALSGAKNPVSDFYSRLKKVNPKDYQVFEEFYKAMYK